MSIFIREFRDLHKEFKHINNHYSLGLYLSPINLVQFLYPGDYRITYKTHPEDGFTESCLEFEDPKEEMIFRLRYL